MKKVFTTLFIVLSFYSLSFAQNFWQSKSTNFELGIYSGYNEAYVTENLNSSGYTGGFNAGISAEMSFSERWGIRGKLTYDQKGWGNGVISTSNGINYGVNYRLTYVTVPIMASWNFGASRNWYLNFGPYMGVLLNAKETTDNIDVKDSFNNTDGGLAFGIGVKFPISENIKFFVETDGQSGLVNIFKDSNGTLFQNVRSSINAGLNFSLD